MFILYVLGTTTALFILFKGLQYIARRIVLSPCDEDKEFSTVVSLIITVLNIIAFGHIEIPQEEIDRYELKQQFEHPQRKKMDDDTIIYYMSHVNGLTKDKEYIMFDNGDAMRLKDYLQMVDPLCKEINELWQKQKEEVENTEESVE